MPAWRTAAHVQGRVRCGMRKEDAEMKHWRRCNCANGVIMAVLVDGSTKLIVLLM